MVNNMTGRITMKKLLFVLLTFYMSFSAFAYANGVEATVSSTEIVAGNMAQLKIKAVGDRAEFPDIKEIDGVKVLGRHQSQNNSYTYVNGKMSNERSTVLILTFAPQKDMTIPSYSVTIDGKVYETKPINIKVVKSTAPDAGNSKFSLQLKTDKRSVIVGEPILATVYFSVKHGVRLSDNPQYNKPEFKGFFVKELGEGRSYSQADREVTELRYALIPKTEGSFTIGPATAKVPVADRSRRDMFGRFFGTTWHPIASNTVNIEVKAKPQDTDLVGSFRIENRIDRQKVKANQPVNLTVKISGKGSLEDFEFPVYEIDGVTVYSDDAKIDTAVAADGMHSSYVKSFAFISDHDFSIPARSISVYDTESKTVKTLEIPSYNITIEGSSAAAVPTVKQGGEPNAGKVQTNLKVPEKSMLDDGEETVEKQAPAAEGWMVILAFVSGMLVMYLLRYLPSPGWKKSIRHYSESEALKILYPHINESPEIEEMVRKLYAKKAGDKNVKIDKNTLREMIERL